VRLAAREKEKQHKDAGNKGKKKEERGDKGKRNSVESV
jgi:hypothetical protein